MDPTRFDALARALSRATRSVSSRRGLLAALGGLLAGPLVGRTETEAKRKRPRVRNRVRRRKQKRNRRKSKSACPTGQLRCAGQCAGCCEDADCGGNACIDGQCRDCPAGQRRCRGGCIAEEACCSDGECTGGRVCIEGTCDCRAHERLCEGACIPNDECCGTDCPPPACSPENCPGCCHGDTCREGDTQRFCGHDGAVCIACPDNTSCDGETCVCPTECCDNADCTAAPGGICQANGFCQYPCIATGAACNGVASCCDPGAECEGDVCTICTAEGDECDPGGTPCCSGGVCMEVSEEIYECFV